MRKPQVKCVFDFVGLVSPPECKKKNYIIDVFPKKKHFYHTSNPQFKCIHPIYNQLFTIFTIEFSQGHFYHTSNHKFYTMDIFPINIPINHTSNHKFVQYPLFSSARPHNKSLRPEPLQGSACCKRRWADGDGWDRKTMDTNYNNSVW